MPAKIGELEVQVMAGLARLQTDMNQAVKIVDTTAKKIESSMGNAFKGVAAGAATVAIAAAMKSIEANAAEAEDALAQVQASLRSTGGAAGVTEKAVLDLSASMKELTALDDDAVTSMQSVLLTFTKVGKEVFPQATEAIANLSVKMKGDLNGAAVQVGKALNDPIKGITALQRVGVSFTESQKAMIKSLVDSGKTLEAQKIILRELETEFGGSAAAARDTLGGALKALEVRVGDVFQALGGDGSGLRYAVELTVTAMVDLESAIKGVTDPASKAGKELQGFSQILSDGVYTARAWANGIIHGAELAWAGISGFAKSAAQLFSAGGAFETTPWGMQVKAAQAAFSGVSKAVLAADATFKLAMKSGAMTDYFSYFDEASRKTDERLKKLHDASSKYKPGAASNLAEGGDPETAKKLAKQLENQHETLQDILHSYERSIQSVSDLTAEQKILNDAKEEEYKISKLTAIPEQERIAALQRINEITKEKLELERKGGIKKEADALKAVLEDMRKDLQIAKDKTAEQEELIPLLNAEERIREITKNHSQENLDLQKQIRDVAKEQSAQILVEQHEKALKSLKEITTEMDDQVAALQRKVDGQEDLNDLLKEEKKIREMKGLTDAEKDAAINHLREQDKKTKDLNKTLAAHKKVIDDITGSSMSHKKQVDALEQAYKNGDISAKEWADAMNDVAKQSSKADQAAKSMASKLTDGIEKIITGGGKVTDIFKDWAKELGRFMANKFFTEPIQRMLSNLFTGVMGGNPANRQANRPGFLPPGVGYSTNPYTGQGQYSYQPQQYGPAGSYPALSPAMGYAQAPSIAGLTKGPLGWLGGMPFTQNNAQQSLGLLNTMMPGWASNYFNNYAKNNPNLWRFAAGLGSIGGNVAGMLGSVFGLRGFARGGTAPGGEWAMFGEEGPELGVPKSDMHIFTAAQTRGLLGPSSSAQQWQNNLSWSAGMSTGDWMAKNERAWQLSQERNYFNQSLAPALNQAWRDSTIMRAQSMTAEMMRSGRTDHIGFDILNRVQNGGSMMMAMAPSFQLPTGDQQFSILAGMARQGVNISPALLQMALDNDWSFTQGRSGLYESGSLGGFMNNPLGYKSMGIEGKTPWKTYQDIDSMDSLAYGGDGSAVVSELMRGARRDANWSQQAAARYIESMQNKNPLGQFIGGGRHITTTGISGKASPWAPSGSSGPAAWTGYGRGGGVSGMPDAPWISTPGDTWQWSKGDQMWSPGSSYEPVDPVNSKWVNDLNFKGRSEAERNQQMGGLGLMLPAMGYASAPRIYSRSVPTVKNVANSSGGFGGTLSPGWLDNATIYNPLFNSRYQPPKASSSFDHWATNPITAGAIDALFGGRRANGGTVQRNRMYQVNERGDELFIPDSSGKIVPLHGGPGMFGGAPNVVVHAPPGVESQVQVNGRDVTIFQRAQMSQDLATGTSGKQLKAAYGLKSRATRRG